MARAEAGLGAMRISAISARMPPFLVVRPQDEDQHLTETISISAQKISDRMTTPGIAHAAGLKHSRSAQRIARMSP